MNHAFSCFLWTGELGPILLDMDQELLRKKIGNPDDETVESEPAVWKYGCVEVLLEKQKTIGIEIDMARVCDSEQTGLFGIPTEIFQKIAPMHANQLQTWLAQIGISHVVMETPSFDPNSTILRTSPRTRFLFQKNRLETISTLLPPFSKQVPSYKDFPTDFVNKTAEVIIFDIDGFKWFNDQLGFDRGSEIINLVSEIIGYISSLSGCSAYRVGGDEFLVAGVGGVKLASVAGDIRNAIRLCSLSIQKPGKPDPSIVDLNAALLTTTPKLFAKWIGVHGLTAEFRDWLGVAIYDQKNMLNAESGVIVDARGKILDQFSEDLCPH